MSTREEILGNVRRGRARKGGDRQRQQSVEARLGQPERGPVPARADLDRAGLLTLFETKAKEASATVMRVGRRADVPAAVADFLAGENLPAEIVMAPDPRLDAIPWDERPMLSITRGRTGGEHAVAVTGAFAGIAETGTLMLLSGPESPTTLNLLPETHIVVIRRREIVGPMEDAWERVRARSGGDLPRTVNFITGPSRSADIGQQLQMGAHGPRRLHIVLVDGED